MLSWLQENWSYIIAAVLAFFSALNAFFSRRTNKNLEDSFMKFRLPTYREKVAADTQSFDPLVTQYRYNKATGELEELPDKLDIQKLIDSSLQTSLEAMFDRFLSPDVLSDEVIDISDTRDTLDRLADAMEFSDGLKEQLGLDEFASLSDVHNALVKQLEQKELELKKIEEEKNRKASIEQLREQLKNLLVEDKGGSNEA